MRSIKRDRRLGALLIPAAMLLTAAGCTGQTQADPSISTSNEALTTLSISGTATGPQGALSGATITLTATATPTPPPVTTTTSSSGAYSFSVAGGGTYTVTASLAGCTFSAPQTFSHIGLNHTANFTATGASCGSSNTGGAGTGGSTGGGGTGGGGAGSGGAGTGGGGAGTSGGGSTGSAGATGGSGGSNVGPQGPPGPQGPVGPPGPVGPQGPLGAMGIPGPIGPIGQMGTPGPMGPMGLTGPPGPPGPKGDPGTAAGLGTNTGGAVPGTTGVPCRVGEMILTAGFIGHGIPARGQTLNIADSPNLFSVIGTTYGGNGTSTFAVPDLRSLTPNHMTYMICDVGVVPTPN